jgi:DNA-binding NtrC family response regulator
MIHDRALRTLNPVQYRTERAPAFLFPLICLEVTCALDGNRLAPPDTHSAEDAMPRISRLLIVDDDPLVLTLLSRLATSRLEQVLVETADSPYLALDRVKTTAYDVVISDVRMPGMNGLDLASRIGTINPFTFIVLISGGREHSEWVSSCNIFAFLEKPIDRHLFLRTVSQALENSRAQYLAAEQTTAVELALYSHCYGD